MAREFFVGTDNAAAALLTPGRALTRRSNSWKKASFFTSVSYFVLGNAIFAVNRFVVRKPGSTQCRRAKLFKRSPVPMSNTVDSATCPATNSPRLFSNLPTLWLATSTLPRNTSARSGRDAEREGNKPNRMPVATEINSVKPSTRPSSRISPVRGRWNAGTRVIACKLHFANKTPLAPPAVASSRLSTSNWPTSRARPAPVLARMANSRERELARPKDRLAKLPQAMRSNNPTASNSIQSIELTFATT